MMRGIRGRRDLTHAPIRQGLRDRGWSVLDNGDAGNGIPDLIAGKDGVTDLIECKSPGKHESENQRIERMLWRGGIWIVAREVEDVLKEHRAKGFKA